MLKEVHDQVVEALSGDAWLASLLENSHLAAAELLKSQRGHNPASGHPGEEGLDAKLLPYPRFVHLREVPEAVLRDDAHELVRNSHVNDE